MTTPESESNMVVGLRPTSYSISVGTTPRSGNTVVTFDDLVIEDKMIPSNNNKNHMHQVTEEDIEREEFENEFYDAVSPLDFITTQFQPEQPQEEEDDEKASQDTIVRAFSSKDAQKKKKKWRRRGRSSVRTWWKSQKITAAQLWYLGLVAFVVLMINSDQNLLAPSLTMIAEEFNMTNEEKDLYLGGYLSIAFFATGGFAAILAGFAADVTSRKATFCVIVFIGELSCFTTLFVTDYWGLFVTRLVTGCAIGGSGPVLYSVVGDTFVDEWRGRAASLLVLLSGGGVLVGQTIAALIAPAWGWRVPFAVVSVPAMIATIILYCMGREPARGSAERVIRTIVEEGAKENIEYEPYSETMSWKKLFKLLKNKTVMILLILSIPTSLPWGFLLVYAQDYLMYDVGPTIPGGISSAQSMAVVIIFSMAGAVGSVVGGYYTDTLWRKNPVLVPLFSGLATALAAIPMYAIANTRMPYYGYCLVVIPAAFLTTLGAISKNAIILNCTVPETRGTAFALNTLFDDLGKGLASFLIALMVVGLGGRVPAFNVAFGGWVLGGFMFACAACTVRWDLKRRTDALMASMRVVSKSSSTTTTDTTSNGGMADKDASVITNEDGYETSAMRTSQTDRTTLEDLNETDDESQSHAHHYHTTMNVNDRQIAIV